MANRSCRASSRTASFWLARSWEPVEIRRIYRQAKEISQVVRWCKPEDDKIDVALLEHISPIEWDNVILYGQYVLDRAQVR